MKKSPKQVLVSPTVDTSAYTAGDVIGGLIRVPRALHPTRRGRLQSVVVREAGTNGSDLTVLLFKEAPTGIAADQAALTLTAADLARLVACVSVATADYKTVGGQRVATVKPEVPVEGYAGDGSQLNDATVGDLWVVIAAVGTPTYAAADALSLLLGVEPDA